MQASLAAWMIAAPDEVLTLMVDRLGEHRVLASRAPTLPPCVLADLERILRGEARHPS